MAHHTDSAQPRQDIATLLWTLLKTELMPYPARYSAALRMVVSCTLVMMITLTFRIPGAALGTYFPFLLPRDSFRSTWQTVRITLITCIFGTIQILLGAIFFAASPLLHFFWSLASIFLVFYCISIMTVTNAAVGLGLLTAGGISIWDMTASTNTRVTLTLYLLLSVLIGCIVTVLVEFIFFRLRQPDVILNGITTRVALVRQQIQAYLAGKKRPGRLLHHRLMHYSKIGTGRLGDVLSGTDYDEIYRSQLATAISLSHDLTIMAAAIAEVDQHPSSKDHERLHALHTQLIQIEHHLRQSQAPDRIDLPDNFTASHTFPELGGLERTIDLLSDVFTEGNENHYQPGTAILLHPHHHAPIFVDDAFTDKRHFRFAVRGTLSAMLCYIFYLSSGWKGLSASIVTCFFTALTSIGATRQRQLLRLLGVLAGGCILGIGSQILLIPLVENLPEFSIIFGGCMFICAWVATSGPRLAFAGAQMALAYDLVTLNRFGITTSLIPARDAILGIFLGLSAMWLIYDHLWATPSATAHKQTFILALRELASISDNLHTVSLKHDRERIGRIFDDLRSFVDTQIFEPHVTDESEEFLAKRLSKWQSLTSALSLILFGLLEHISHHGMQSAISQKTLQQASRTLSDIASMFEKKSASFPDEDFTLILHSIEHKQAMNHPLHWSLAAELRLNHALIVLTKEIHEKAIEDIQSLQLQQFSAEQQESGLAQS